MQTEPKLRRNFTDGYKKISQQFICNQYSKLCRNLFTSEKSTIEITRTSSTLAYNNTKIVCSKKVQMRKIIKPKRQMITKHRNISINVSNIEDDDEQSIFERFEQGKRLVSQLIKQALVILEIKFQQWTTDWQKYTDDKKKLLFALKVIQIQYLKIKSQITDIMDNRRFKQFRDILDIDIKIPDPDDYVNAVLQQFPQIYDFFQNFNLSCIASEGISQMKALQLQTLPFLIQLDQQLGKRKKNKKKNKKKKKKNASQIQKGQNVQQVNQQSNIQQTKDVKIEKNQDDTKYNQVLSFLTNFTLKEEQQKNMESVRVYSNWIQKLNKRNLQLMNNKKFKPQQANKKQESRSSLDKKKGELKK